MKKILYIIPMLLLIASCAKEQEQEPQNVQVPFNITIATKAGGSGSEVEPAIVNSVRVLIFNKQTAASTDPICIANEYYPFGFTTTVDEDGTTLVKVNPTIYLESPLVKEYDVFVVLNEEGYTISGGTSLTETLSDVELNSLESAFTAILATKADYSTTTEETAMLMSAGQTVTYTSAETPIQVHFNATTDPSSALKRTMAMISVDKIISKPSADGTGTYDKELPKIFVLDASIENVPAGIDWDSSEDGSTAPGTVSLPLGEANADGYYDRIWEGTVLADIAAKVTKNEYACLNLYKTTWTLRDTPAKNYDKKKDYQPRKLTTAIPGDDKTGDLSGWAFDQKSAKTFTVDLTDETIFDNNSRDFHWNGKYEANTYEDDYIEAVYTVASNYKKAINKPTMETLFAPNPKANSSVLSRLMDDDCNVATTEYVKSSFTRASQNVRCTEESWMVKLGNTYYVPENISSTAADATYISIKLAIADPSLTFTGTMAQLPDPYEVTEGTLTYNYYIGNTTLATTGGDGKLTLGPEADIRNAFGSNGHVVNADEETTEYTTENLVNNFHVYVDGFSRKSRETLDATCVITKEDAERATPTASFSWNIPLADGTDTHVYEFKIPVNNNLDKNGDYSIHRNTKYNVTLKVGSTTYGQLVTKSGEGEQALTVTATVTTEKINDNED